MSESVPEGAAGGAAARDANPAEPVGEGVVVTARPIKMVRVGYLLAALVFAVFAFTAVEMRRLNDGVPFDWKDQWGTFVIGVILAGCTFMLTRPRLVADRDSIRTRSFLGHFRTIPWDLVVRIDFPRKVRFARIVLPAEETLPIYAVQRWDERQSVVVMRRLRELHAEVSAAQER